MTGPMTESDDMCWCGEHLAKYDHVGCGDDCSEDCTTDHEGER